MQQLKIIEYFVKQNYTKTNIVPCKTIRDKNGVACSSRNFLLSMNEKNIASKIYKFLISRKKILVKNKFAFKTLKIKILELGATKIDYIQILDINKVIKPFKQNKKYKIFIAYYLRSIRLIDNI